MSKLDDILDGKVLAIQLANPADESHDHKVTEIEARLKQQIKDLMLELFENNYQVLPIQPAGRPLYITNGIVEKIYRRMVDEL